MFKQLKPAFTLIELLIVIGVIAILSAGIIIGVRDATRAARETAALVFSNTIHKTLITDMVGEWTFDDETNPGYDSSGKGNNGTLVGPPTWTADGKVRGALEFNGGGDYVNCGNKPSLNITNAITIEAWVKFTNKSYNIYVWKDLATLMQVDATGVFTVQVYVDGNWRYDSTTGTVSNNQWNHLIGTYNSLTHKIRFYINGVEDANSPKTLTGLASYTINSTPSADVIIGNYSTYYILGTLDEVRIYNAALEASQIKARYAKGLQKLHSKGKLNGVEYYQRLTETGF